MPHDPKEGWTPVLSEDGKTFCSPRCGGRCTLRAYEAATSDAVRVAVMTGPAFVPRVWENLGWHCEAIGPGGMRVREFVDRNYGTRTYHASLDLPDPVKGAPYTMAQFFAEADTPRAATTAARRKAATFARDFLDALEAVRFGDEAQEPTT